MTQLTFTAGQVPVRMTGTITFNAGGTGNYTIGESVTGSGFSAKVVKWVAATRKLTIKTISGTPSGVITGGSSSAAWTVATTNQVTSGGIAVNTGGWNIRVTDHGITRSKTIGSRVLGEVLLATAKLNTKRTDFGTVPTFTLTAITSASPYDVSNGDYMVFTITASEAIEVYGQPTFPFTITGIGAKTATYYNMTGNVLTFRYQVVSGDIGGTAISVPAANFAFPGSAAFADIANGSVKKMTGTIGATGTTLTQSTITIQA